MFTSAQLESFVTCCCLTLLHATMQMLRITELLPICWLERGMENWIHA